MIKNRPFTGENVTKFDSGLFQEYFPTNTEEVQKIIKYALENQTSIYPISTGRNWGLGSKLPPNEDSIIVNLIEMNQILHYDESKGIVEIEPGVTQEQLENYLKQRNSDYFIDVTGSSKSSSIVGNALERGIGYNKLRAENVLSLEIITGENKIIQTGQARFSNATTKFLYKYGVGADLTGLFFQSNFGVVTKMRIKLEKKKKHHFLVQLNFNNVHSFSNSLRSFQELMEDNIIESIFHLANRARAKNAITKELQLLTNKDSQSAELLLNKVLKAPWVASGVVSSNYYLIALIKAIILRKKLSSYSKVKILNFRFLTLTEKIFKFFRVRPLFNVLKSIKPFRVLYQGRTTDAALGSVLDFKTYKENDQLSEKVDLASSGFHYCLPITKLEKESCLEMIEIIQNIAKDFNLDPSITLNPLNSMILEAVVSVDYTEDTAKNAHTCIRKMNIELIKAGHIPYRSDIKNMDLFLDKESEYYQYLKRIKDSFDPQNIISPGRYLNHR